MYENEKDGGNSFSFLFISDRDIKLIFAFNEGGSVGALALFFDINDGIALDETNKFDGVQYVESPFS